MATKRHVGISSRLWEKLKPLAREMRRHPTAAERALWEVLRDRRLLGMKFRRQHAIGRFIVDFYCADAQLVIEVDGMIHQQTQEADAERTAYLEARGLRVIRFRNTDVLHDITTVVATLERVLR